MKLRKGMDDARNGRRPHKMVPPHEAELVKKTSQANDWIFTAATNILYIYYIYTHT